MNSTLKFNRFYFLLAIILFGIEVLIAKFAHDRIVRPYIGDLLVVILIYCFVKSFLDTPYLITAIAVLTFSYVIETLQYFHIVEILGLEKSKLASTVIGTSFAWEDIAAYTVGSAMVIYLESKAMKRKAGTNLETI
jgi:hypothetical protein